MPPPSSLIFVAIVVAWGAYLLPRWVSRRDALGQARGLDRFSSGLRVLDRRGRRPAGPSTTALLTTTRRVSAEPAATPGFDEIVAVRGVTVADRARTATVTAARRRKRVLTFCLLTAVAGWTAFGLELVSWPVAAAAAVLLPVDLVALVVSARARAARRRRAARAVAREVALRRPAGGRCTSSRRSPSVPCCTARRWTPEIDRDADTAELDLRPLISATAAAAPSALAATAPASASVPPPPWPVDLADGVLLDDGPVATGSIPVWAMMTAAAAAAASATPGGAVETAPGWPQVERRVRDRRALRRPTADRRAAENVGTGRRLAAVDQVEGSWQPVAVPLPTYTMKSQAPRASSTRGADGVEPEVAVRPGVARPWVPERPGGEAVDLDEVLARRRAVNG